MNLVINGLIWIHISWNMAKVEYTQYTRGKTQNMEH